MTTSEPGMGHNRPPMLIGLWSPVMGSGKTTIAEYLTERHGFVRMAMADALKRMFEMFLQASGMSAIEAHNVVRDPVLKEQPLDVLCGKTPRHAMQTLGTEWGRDQIDPDVWARSAMGRASVAMAAGHSVVFDDIRFPNEAEAVAHAGGFMVSVERPGATLTSAHPSEGALAGWGFAASIYNTSSIEDLRKNVDYTVGLLRNLNL